MSDLKKTDLIIIPALSGDLKAMVEVNKEFVPWIIEQYHQGAEVAFLCLGAFLLASTGLLDGRSCSTHWLSQDEFRAMFPAVTMTEGTIITEIDVLYSSGGASSYWNLLLHIIEICWSRDIYSSR